MNSNQAYDQSSIQVLKGLSAVRLRPGMYVGSTGKRGLHHLVWEVLDNSVDESMAGHCSHIKITLHKPGDTITIEDNGRGIPVENHKTENKSTLDVVLTTLHAGGKFGGSGYQTSGGLHGVGVSCVNALSEKMEVTVWRKDKLDKFNYGEHKIELSCGEVIKPVYSTNNKSVNKNGTQITFTPDKTIFPETKFDEHTLIRRFKEVAFLNAGLKITFKSEVTDILEEFCYHGGIADYISFINTDKSQFNPIKPFYGEKKINNFQLFLSFQYTSSDDETILSFANNINTSDGGTHLSGFKTSFTRTINQLARSGGFLKEKDQNLTGDDVRDGITAIISIRMPQPQFEGQTKSKLGSVEAESLTSSITSELLNEYFEKNPAIAKIIIERAVLCAKARYASKKASDTVKRQTFLGMKGRMPDKLYDCDLESVELTELYIVEGDSAAGGAVGGRDPETQAILPVKGKIINPDKHDLSKLLANDEISALINAIGTGILKEFDINKLRYGKIIILTDSDDDGAHIRTLLLTFFYRFMNPLVNEGKIYLANPPLYRINQNNKFTYLNTDKDLEKFKSNNKTKFELTRFKGLGEMNSDELGSTTMKKGQRVLTKITLDDAISASKILQTLMGSDVQPRKKHIIGKAALR